MAVNVTRIGKNTYAVAHNFVQNGDLMADPDVEFTRVDGMWIPCAIQQDALGSYVRSVHHDDGAIDPFKVNSRAQHDLASFCNLWMKNIEAQQGDLTARRCEDETMGTSEPAGPQAKQLSLF